MKSKEMLVEMYMLSIDNIGMFEKADRLRECFNKIADDLEKLEKYEKIFKEPLKNIRERLERLEKLKKWFMENTTDYREYDHTLFVDTFIRKDEPIFKIVGEWLDEEQRRKNEEA